MGGRVLFSPRPSVRSCRAAAAPPPSFRHPLLPSVVSSFLLRPHLSRYGEERPFRQHHLRISWSRPSRWKRIRNWRGKVGGEEWRGRRVGPAKRVATRHAADCGPAGRLGLTRGAEEGRIESRAGRVGKREEKLWVCLSRKAQRDTSHPGGERSWESSSKCQTATPIRTASCKVTHREVLAC